MNEAYQIATAKKRRTTLELEQLLCAQGQILMPMVELIEQGQIMVHEFLMDIQRTVIEAVVDLSARELAGEPHPGRRGGEIRRHGHQQGSVCVATHKLRLKKPRLRQRGGGEVKVPAYEAMRNNAALTEQVGRIVMEGVSTRGYGKVIPASADTCGLDTVGISKSSVSREFIEMSTQELEALCARRFDELELLIIYIDGMRFGKHQAIGAIGVDRDGNKHVLGVAEGATEHKNVVTGLLRDLVQRGIDPLQRRLFVIDGSLALRAAIEEVFGKHHPVQRCRKHKIDNVLSYLPKELQPQIRTVMTAAYKMEAEAGIAKLKQQARWLEKEYPSARSSLLEGLEETFTINRLHLPAALRRCLATTNIIESPHSGVRRRTRQVTNWDSGNMVLRWTATSLVATEKNFRRIMGYSQLWMLNAALNDDWSAQKREVVAA